MRKLVLLALVAAGLATAGCHTIAGMGKDVQSAGNAVTDTANDASH